MKKNKRTRRGKVTIEEIDFIRAYSVGENALTDNEMARQLGGSDVWIRKVRRENNISKSGVSRKKTTDEKIVAHKVAIGDKTVINDLKQPSNEAKSIKEIYSDIFKNTSQYSILKQMFSKTELEYYLEEFSALVSEIKAQGGTLTTSEFRNLDQWIQLMVRKNRLAIQEKEAIDVVQRTLSPFDGNLDEAGDEQRAIVFQIQTSVKDIPKNIKEITEQSIKIQSELEMTRKERLKRMADSEKGVLHVIQTMQDDEKRARVDRQAAMLAEAQKKIKEEWIKEGLLLTVEKEDLVD